MDELTIERFGDDPVADRRTLRLSGPITIGEAAGFREALLDALNEASVLRLDLSGVTGVDLNGLQILCAAHQSAERIGKRFEIVGERSEIFRKVSADAGFQRHIGCSRDNTHSCIWVEERTYG